MVRTEKDFAAADAARRRKEKRKRKKEKEAAQPAATTVAADPPKKAKAISANWQSLAKVGPTALFLPPLTSPCRMCAAQRRRGGESGGRPNVRDGATRARVRGSSPPPPPFPYGCCSHVQTLGIGKGKPGRGGATAAKKPKQTEKRVLEKYVARPPRDSCALCACNPRSPATHRPALRMPCMDACGGWRC